MKKVLTFAAVCFAWVFFRAADFPGALKIAAGMAGLNGITLPDAIGARIGSLKLAFDALGVQWTLGGATRFIETWGWVLAAGGIAFLLPNTQEIMRGRGVAPDAAPEKGLTPAAAPVSARTAGKAPMVWRPSARWAVAVGALAVLGVLSLNRPSDFLYFQF